jgi:hypothetical protein
MAKSLRSKVKQAAGRKRRSDSHYAVAEAARIQRLSDKLLAKSESDKEAKAAEVPAAEEGDDSEMKEGRLIHFDVRMYTDESRREETLYIRSTTFRKGGMEATKGNDNQGIWKGKGYNATWWIKEL